MLLVTWIHDLHSFQFAVLILDINSLTVDS